MWSYVVGVSSVLGKPWAGLQGYGRSSVRAGWGLSRQLDDDRAHERQDESVGGSVLVCR